MGKWNKRSMGFDQIKEVQVLTVPFVSYETLSKLHALSELLSVFSYLSGNNSTLPFQLIVGFGCKKKGGYKACYIF